MSLVDLRISRQTPDPAPRNVGLDGERKEPVEATFLAHDGRIFERNGLNSSRLQHFVT